MKFAIKHVSAEEFNALPQQVVGIPELAGTTVTAALKDMDIYIHDPLDNVSSFLMDECNINDIYVMSENQADIDDVNIVFTYTEDDECIYDHVKVKLMQ